MERPRPAVLDMAQDQTHGVISMVCLGSKRLGNTFRYGTRSNPRRSLLSLIARSGSGHQRHLHRAIGLQGYFPRLHPMRCLEAHMEVLGAAAGPLLPLARPARSLLDGRQASQERAAAPPTMPPLRPRTGNYAPPPPCLPILPTSMA